MNDIIGNWVDLDSLIDNFLNKFTKCIEEDYGIKHL